MIIPSEICCNKSNKQGLICIGLAFGVYDTLVIYKKEENDFSAVRVCLSTDILFLLFMK